jgi:acylglycerol lipase
MFSRGRSGLVFVTACLFIVASLNALLELLLCAPAGAQSKEKAEHVRKQDVPLLSWIKPGKPVRAVLLCVHGLGLYSQSWTSFGLAISSFGIATYALDVQGFGSFIKAKGRNNCDFKACLDNVEDTLEQLRKSNPGKPVFLMGESMGGAIALHVAAESPELMDGVISVCSSGDRFKQKKMDLDVFLHMLAGPRRKFDIGDKIVDQAAGKDPKLKEAWEGDALDEMHLSPLELMQFQHFMNENHEMATRISSTPVLMMQGTEDELVKPEGTEELYEELKTKDKELIRVKNGKHLIFEEEQFSQDTLSEVINWIFLHCPTDSSLTFEEAMEKGRASLDAGDLPVALSNIQIALKLKPGDANAHFQMGFVRMHMRQFFQAHRHLALAARLGRGQPISEAANRALLSLPPAFVAPHLKVPGRPAAQPGVILFNAKWCKPCDQMEGVMKEAEQRYGNKIKFQRVDVDNSANAELIDHFSIGPIPTTVFLTASGDVAFSQVGFGGKEAMMKGLRTIAPAVLLLDSLAPGAGRTVLQPVQR